VYAPQAAQVARTLSSVALAPGDRRQTVLRLALRQTQLIEQAMAMGSVPGPDGKPAPVDPQRAQAIELELASLPAALAGAADELKAAVGQRYQP
jgi:hypothetical protein